MEVVRLLIYAMLVIGFGLGALSVVLRRRKALGLTGLALATAGTLLGGAGVEIAGPVTRDDGPRPRLVPAEPLRPRAPLRPSRAHLRALARAADLPSGLDDRPHALRHEPPLGAADGRAHHAAGGPALPLGDPALATGPGRGPAPGRSRSWRSWSWPTSRSTPCTGAFTRFRGSGASTPSTTRRRPWTGWPARACTCSTSSSRAGLSFVPLYVLGFAPPAVYAYLVFVSFHAVFIHANVRFDCARSTGCS